MYLVSPRLALFAVLAFFLVSPDCRAMFGSLDRTPSSSGDSIKGAPAGGNVFPHQPTIDASVVVTQSYEAVPPVSPRNGEGVGEKDGGDDPDTEEGYVAEDTAAQTAPPTYAETDTEEPNSDERDEEPKSIDRLRRERIERSRNRLERLKELGGKSGSSKRTERPLAPRGAQPAPPSSALAAGETVDDEDVITISSEMSIGDLIQLMSELTGEVYLPDESVKTKRVTIVAPHGIMGKNAKRVFDAILDLHGFSIVKKGSVNLIVPKRDIKTQSLPLEVGDAKSDTSDRFVTRVVQLKNLSASDVANTLRPFVSKEGDIVAYPSSNTLIIVEIQSNLRRLLDLIDNIDVKTVVEFIKIQNMEAAEMAQKIVEIFGGGSTTTVPVASKRASGSAAVAQRQRASRERRTTGRAAGAQGTGAQGQQFYLGFKIVIDERTNTLIITAHGDDLKKIKAIIKKLDVEVDQPEQGIYVIRLQNADADQMVGVLSNLISGTGGTTSRGRTQRTTTPRTTTRGVLTGTTTGRRGLSQAGDFSALSSSAIQRQLSQGGGISAIVAEADGLRITADSPTNSIIIIGSRKDYEIIVSVVDQLDIRRKQVFVEAVIMEVSLDQLRSVGANLSLGFTFNNDNLGFGGSLLPGVPSLLGIAASSEAAISLLGGLSGLFLGVIGEEVDPDGSGPIPPIPSFSAIFQALTSLTDVNILSTPSLLTIDNEEAEIVVADIIPFPTGTTVGTSGVTVQTIDRQPVGIRLAITPQIGEGDYLYLNIHTEVSEVRQATVPGLNTQEFGIATTTRTADSSVVVKDGQTIVIGGLVQDRVSTLVNKVPLLGDIPLLGRLFQFKQRSSRKINLMILLTPRIISDERDMQEILEERQRKNMLLREQGGYR
ncbi:MAG: type II secretion system secretin GspD [Thermodesulfobacteriota bacterium]